MASEEVCLFLTDLLSEFEENPNVITGTSFTFLSDMKVKFNELDNQIYISGPMLKWLADLGRRYGLDYHRDYELHG